MSKITLTQPLIEMINANPDLVVFDGKRIKFPNIDLSESAGKSQPNRAALQVEEDASGLWVVKVVER